MKRIQDKSWFYSFAHYCVNASFRMAYRRYEMIGTEKIPTDGAIIFAPNHTNCLQDALAVLSLDNKPKVFVARADIFKNPKLKKILNWMKIMPIMRIRDGYSNLQKNDEIMKYAVEVLEDKVPFCIMPEGRHRPMHSLLPLGKGIFRIALQANEKIEERVPVYIVPFGLEYGNFFRYRSSLLIEIGNPINVTSYLKENATLTIPEQMNGLKELLTKSLEDCICYIPDNEEYNALLTLCQVCSENSLVDKNKKRSLHNRLIENKNILEKIKLLKTTDSQNANELIEKGKEIHDLAQANKISANSLKSKKLIKNIIGRIAQLIFFLPYFIASFIVDAPIFLISELITLKIKDKAFCNSVRFVINLLLSPIILTITAIVLFSSLIWWKALIVFILLIPKHAIVHDYLCNVRLLFSDIKLLKNKKLTSLINEVRKKL
ncbi:MAG: 1-acyl-sn-glycerol-3-phosphate acyltransferase [Paludibacteraceae bacterium]|nr:1-acyl-sn-glycerol-3-phosphate acyltransferase [Paludibacteraceae bacterium]